MTVLRQTINRDQSRRNGMTHDIVTVAQTIGLSANRVSLTVSAPQIKHVPYPTPYLERVK